MQTAGEEPSRLKEQQVWAIWDGQEPCLWRDRKDTGVASVYGKWRQRSVKDSSGQEPVHSGPCPVDVQMTTDRSNCRKVALYNVDRQDHRAVMGECITRWGWREESWEWLWETEEFLPQPHSAVSTAKGRESQLGEAYWFHCHSDSKDLHGIGFSLVTIGVFPAAGIWPHSSQCLMST